MAYAADARRSSHPVAPTAEEVPDVDAATGNFDALSYAKGGSCLRQLVTWIGEDAFYAGVNAYLSRHAWGNTTLADFVAALDEATDRDVRSWVEAWLRTTGFDTITATRDGDDGRAHQGRQPSAPAPGHVVRRRLARGLLETAWTWPTTPSGCRAPRSSCRTQAGETFARVRLDDQSWAAVEAGLSRVPDDLARALLWSVATDRARVGDLALDDLLALVRDHLPVERHPAIVSAVLRWVGIVLPLVASADDVADARRRHGRHLCRRARQRARARPRRRLDPQAGWRPTPTPTACAPGPTSRDDPALRWIALHRLASLGELDAAALEHERLADGTVVGDLGAGRALAALPDAAGQGCRLGADDRGPAHLQPPVRGHGRGVLGRRADRADRAVRRPLLGRGPSSRCGPRAVVLRARSGNALPHVPLTDEQVGDLETALAGDVPAILRRDWEDALDDLRAVRKA